MALKSHSLDMCNGPILPNLLKMSWPLMVSGLMNLAFNAADMIVVGHFGSENAMAAVGSTGSMVSLLVNLFGGLSLGTGILSARHLGARDEERVSETVHTSMTLSLFNGLFLAVIGLLFSGLFLRWMSTPDEVIGLSTLYLRIYFVGMIPGMISSFAGTILNAQGDTKRPALFGMLAGAINVALNLLLVIVFKMDVAGVAIATVVAQTFSAVMNVICLLREPGMCHLDIRKLRLNMKVTLEILRIGVPSALQNVAFSVPNVMIQSSINAFGPIVMAGNAVAVKIEEFINIAMVGFWSGGSTFVSQNFGAKKYKRIDRAVFVSGICTFVSSLTASILALIFARPLIGIFDPRPEVLEPAITRLWTICLLYFVCGLMSMFAGAIRGMGYSILPTVVTLVGVCGFRLLWLLTVFQIPRFHTLEMLYACYGISWTITLIAHVICFVRIRKKLQVVIG